MLYYYVPKLLREGYALKMVSRFPQGTRAICETCIREISFSHARNPNDPWNHLELANHKAVPRWKEQTVRVTVRTPILREAFEDRVFYALGASFGQENVHVSKQQREG